MVKRSILLDVAASSSFMPVIMLAEARLHPGTLKVRTVSIDNLKNMSLKDIEGQLPVGTVEFVQTCLRRLGRPAPPPPDYSGLEHFLHRNLWETIKGRIATRPEPVFLKPRNAYKTFTGFVLGTDPEQDAIVQGLPDNFPVWVSEPVTFLSECRYYVKENALMGFGRYDDGDETAPLPDPAVIRNAIACMTQQGMASYALDFGVLDSGETALVEVTDAWASGYYKDGTMTPLMFLDWLDTRYRQLANEPHRER